MAKTKDTIYIDVDDEITSIVEKVENAGSDIVALVLPKRAVVLQSIVNMKLLKRAADESGKKVVLITSETGLMPLAGATGVYVARNLQSKPEVPEKPDLPSDNDDEVVEDMETMDEEEKGAMVGAAAVGAATGSAIANKAKGSATKTSKKTKSSSKTPKIPNFEKFRKKIFIIAGAVILLVVLWYLAVFVAPKATIAIETNTETFDSSFEFTADTTKESVDVDGQTIPARFETKEVNETESSGATGTKDVGTKAKGTVTIRNCTDSGISVKSGTGVSSNGKTFITQSSLSLGSGNFDSGGDCKTSGSHVGSVQVVAKSNGSDYNLASGSAYSVSGFNSDVSGTGSAMTGGSSKTIKVVSNQDVDSAKEKLDINEDNIKDDLKKELEDAGYFVIDSSFNKSGESVSASPEVGQEATEVSVKYSAKFTLIGIKKDDLKKLIEDSLKDDVDIEKQALQNDGIEDASFEVTDRNGDTATINYDGQAEVGPDIDIDGLKESILGMKKGDTENIISQQPGVKSVTIDYSPFWVNKTPSKAQKIEIKFESANQE